MRYPYGLKWARECEAPVWARTSHARGAKALGRRYERQAARALGPAVTSGQWFEFEDSRGLGYGQTDLLLRMPSCVVVLECKYTWTDAGHQQLAAYKPVVEMVYGLPVALVQVCKVLRMGMPAGVMVTASLQEAVKVARSGAECPVVLHWIGVGRLWPETADLRRGAGAMIALRGVRI